MMFNYCTTPKDSFQYWYTRIGVSNLWNVSTNDNNHGFVCMYNEDSGLAVDADNGSYTVHDPTIVRDFLQFKACRPEYNVGRHIDPLSILSYTDPKDIINDNMYDRMIAGIFYITCANDKIAQQMTERCLNWLHGTDFYAAPASTKYHESYPCGLIQHHLTVYNKMVELLGTATFDNKVNVPEALLTALVHDWCKIDFYESYQKNVKDEHTGQWYQEMAYRCKGSTIPLGHGVTSMFMAMKFFKISTEQALAIRWHMQAYNVCDNEAHDLMDAAENYMMVRLLQLADQMSIIQEKY